METTPVSRIDEARPSIRASGLHKTAVVIQVPRWKRLLDITLIVLLVPIIAPLALLICLVIKVVSRGPVLFRQERIGFTGKPFECLKFRTMKVNAPIISHQGYLTSLMKSDEPMTKMDLMGDPRLIPLGFLLRATGLDELPQLINVLRGEMSIVGPRPCTQYEYAHYLPEQLERFNSLPGLTGLWQVSGKNKTTFEEMVDMDIRYVEGKTLGWDLLIILKTGPAILLQVIETIVRRKRG